MVAPELKPKGAYANLQVRKGGLPRLECNSATGWEYLNGQIAQTEKGLLIENAQALSSGAVR